MKVIYRSKYLTLAYDSENRSIKRYWYRQSADMDEAIFKAEITQVIKFVKIHKPQYLIADLTDFAFVMVPDLQEWCDKHIYSQFSTNNVVKMAIVRSAEFYSEISVELAFEESPKNYETAFFETLEEAEKWIEQSHLNNAKEELIN